MSPSPSGCPPADDLAAYAERALGAPRRGEVEAHAAGCRRCQDALRLVLSPEAALQVPPAAARARPWPRWTALAAAALLLAVLPLLAWRRLSAPPAARPGGEAALRPSPSAVWPDDPAVRLPAQGLAAEGIDLVPGEGFLASAGRDGSGRPVLGLAAGSAWIRCSDRRPLVLRTPSGPLVLQGASVWISTEPATEPGLSSLFCRSALAGDADRLRLLPLEGRLAWPGGGTPRLASPGEILLAGPGGIETRRCDEGLVERLRRARGGRLLALGAWRDLLPAPVALEERTPGLLSGGLTPPRYRLLVLLKGRGQATEVAVLIPTAAGERQWTMMLPSRDAGDRVAIEICFDGTVLRGRVDGRVALEAEQEGLAGALEPSPEPAGPPGRWGVRSWGGPVRVQSARLQELP